MTSKRSVQADVLSAGTATPRRTGRTGAKHSRKPAASVETAESTPAEHDAIASLAYSYWESRGFQGGSPEEDWFRAEQSLLSN